MRPLAIFVLLLALTGCSSSTFGQGAPTSAQVGRYRVMVTEPSGNIHKDSGKLFMYWSCDPNVNPDLHYQGGQRELWTDVAGNVGQPVLLADVTCPAAHLLTVVADGGIVALDTRPTTLRCQVSTPDGREVASETVTRGRGTSDPICRVLVPSE